MSDKNYKPWREDHEPVDLLAAQASETWAALLSDSRRCVDTLREITKEADQRLDLGRRLLEALARHDAAANGTMHNTLTRRLDAFETRLDAMEARLTELEIDSIEQRPFPLHMPNRHAA